MTTLREAAQQALEAWQTATYGHPSHHKATLLAMTALRAALAQPQIDPVDEYRKSFIAGQIDMRDREETKAEPVEPVAWMVYTEGGASAYVTDNPRDLIGAYRALALYTTPPQRKPLTEEEIDNICRQAHGGADPQEWARNFARAVERAHGIGETK